MDLQVLAVAAVEGEHAPLPLRLAAGQALLDGLHGVRIEAVQELVGLGPGLFGVARDDVQPDAEADGAPFLRRQPPYPGDLLGGLGRRFAPGEVDVDVAGGDLAGDG